MGDRHLLLHSSRYVQGWIDLGFAQAIRARPEQLPLGQSTRHPLRDLTGMATPVAWEILRAEAFQHLSRSRCALGTLVKKIGPCTLQQAPDLFDCLVRSIIAQFISTKAAETISSRICLAGGKKRFHPEGIAKQGPDGLKALGLSGSKSRFLMGAAELWLERKIEGLPVPHSKQPDVEATLAKLAGVGPWTLDMLRIFALGRPDVFPIGDYGLRTGMASLFKLRETPEKEAMIRLAMPWVPFRTFATWYIWRSKGSVPQS